MGTPATATTTKKKQPPRVPPVLTAIRNDVTMPVRATARGSKTIYPFDDLQVGQSFGVSNKTAENMTSIISNQNRKTYPLLDSTGKVVLNDVGPEIKDANGAVIGHGTPEAKTYSKHFFAVNVDAKTDPDKVKVRVWRDK